MPSDSGWEYQYSHRDEGVANANLPTTEDQNFISLYLDKSACRWLSIGVNGGYGYIQTSLLGRNTGKENVWNVSPHFVLWHSWGAFSASLNTSYQYAWTNLYNAFPGTVGSGSVNETGRVFVTLGLGYAVTEKLGVQATAAYTGITKDESTSQNLPEARKSTSQNLPEATQLGHIWNQAYISRDWTIECLRRVCV
jgi:hypothetical protein